MSLSLTLISDPNLELATQNYSRPVLYLKLITTTTSHTLNCLGLGIQTVIGTSCGLQNLNRSPQRYFRSSKNRHHFPVLDKVFRSEVTTAQLQVCLAALWLDLLIHRPLFCPSLSLLDAWLDCWFYNVSKDFVDLLSFRSVYLSKLAQSLKDEFSVPRVFGELQIALLTPSVASKYWLEHERIVLSLYWKLLLAIEISRMFAEINLGLLHLFRRRYYCCQINLAY